MKEFELTPSGKLPSFNENIHANLFAKFSKGFMLGEYYSELFANTAKDKGCDNDEVERIRQFFLTLDYSEYHE